ncbi:MAG: hypothetical protein ACR2PL_26740 [Dehalococcoidia bacterium]
MNYVGGYDDKWWKLEKRLERALDRISDDLSAKHGRRLTLESPVLIPGVQGEQIRAPIVLRGGPKEFPVAYLHISDVKVNGKRADAVAAKAAELARAAIEGTSSAPGKDVIINYP